MQQRFQLLKHLFIYADIVDTNDNLKCLLCHTYQVTIGDTSHDETATPNACALCGCKLSTTKTSDNIVTSSSPQLLMQSFDLSSLPADEYGLVHNLWQLWGQNQQIVLSQEQSVTLPPEQQVASSSHTQKRKRTRSFGTKQIGF